MNEDFRNRVAVPILLPIAVLLGAAVFVVGLAVVLLAIPAAAATIIALLVAAYVLGVSAMLVKRRTISGRAVGVGIGLGMAALVVAAVIAVDVGPREITPPTLEDDEEEVVDEDPEEDVDVPDDAYEFVAVDIDYAEAPETVSSGLVTFAIINEGALYHDVVIEELDDLEVVFAAGGEVDVGEVELEAGEEYTYYCSIPGHREAGMEGTFTVED